MTNREVPTSATLHAAYPDARVTTMLSGVAVAAVVAQDGAADRPALAGQIVVAPDAGPECDTPPSVQVHPDQLAWACGSSSPTPRTAISPGQSLTAPR